MWTAEGEPKPSDEVVEKAERYIAERKIEYLGKGDLFTVYGTEEYLVVLQGDKYYCTCPSTTTCSHVLAARTRI